MPSTPSELVNAYAAICNYLKKNCMTTEEERENIADTPLRAARALLETTVPHTVMRSELREIISRVFPSNKAARLVPGVVHGPVPVVSLCPHHLMLVEYEAYLTYLPVPNKIIGISKLSRIAQLLGKRPVLQEQLSEDIADALWRDPLDPTDQHRLESTGSAVFLQGRHTCQSCRGVRSPAFTCTTAIRGDFVTDPSLEPKFFQQIELVSRRHSR